MPDLQRIAEADLKHTLEGDGQRIKLVSPLGVQKFVDVLTNDIGLMLDPETGVAVSGRSVSVAIRMSSLRSVGLDIPKGIDEAGENAWMVEYSTVRGDVVIARVMSSLPDYAMGLVVLRLELVQ